MNIFLVLPAFNEEASLPLLLESWEKQSWRSPDFQIILVNDGSSDGTARVAQDWSVRLPVEIVTHAQNRGLGETILDGLARAAELAQPQDAIVAMDADNTQPIALIPRMVRGLEEGKDIVIASRFQPGAKVLGLSPFRHFLTLCARVLYQAVLPVSGVRDYTCGFRAYRAGLLQHAFKRYGSSLVTERGFACMAEILVKLAGLGAKVGEVPMILRYDQKLGASKMGVASTVRESLLLLLRHRRVGKQIRAARLSVSDP
jgi:dolichol-phosphate mannosyltransferase